MGAVESSFDEVQNIFDIGGSKGLAGDTVDKIPTMKMTHKNIIDASGERASCSVCLQVLPPQVTFDIYVIKKRKKAKRIRKLIL